MSHHIYFGPEGSSCSSVQQGDPGFERDTAAEATWELETQARPATLLGLELLLQEPVVNLGSVVSLLLADVAAALRVAQLAAREVGPGCKAPVRLAECIATIDLNRLLKELSE